MNLLFISPKCEGLKVSPEVSEGFGEPEMPSCFVFFFTTGRKQPDSVFHLSPSPCCHCAGNSAGRELRPKHVFAPDRQL